MENKLKATLTTSDGRQYQCVLDIFCIEQKGNEVVDRILNVNELTNGRSVSYVADLLEETYSKEYLRDGFKTAIPIFNRGSNKERQTVRILKTEKVDSSNISKITHRTQRDIRINESGKDEDVYKDATYLLLHTSSSYSNVGAGYFRFHGRILDMEGNPSTIRMHGREIVDCSVDIETIYDHKKTDVDVKVNLRGVEYTYTLKSFHQNINTELGNIIKAFYAGGRFPSIVYEIDSLIQAAYTPMIYERTIGVYKADGESNDTIDKARRFIADLTYTLVNSPNGSDLVKVLGEVRARHQGNASTEYNRTVGLSSVTMQGRSVVQPNTPSVVNKSILFIGSSALDVIFGEYTKYDEIEDWTNFDTTNHVTAFTAVPLMLLPSGMEDNSWEELVRCSIPVTAEDEIRVPMDLGRVTQK